jgi:hypothetical protein
MPDFGKVLPTDRFIRDENWTVTAFLRLGTRQSALRRFRMRAISRCRSSEDEAEGFRELLVVEIQECFDVWPGFLATLELGWSNIFVTFPLG